MHQKRMSMPTSWKVPKKTNKWITATSPGPHTKDASLPLVVVVRDLLKVVDTAKEAKKVLMEGKVLIDGVKRKDLKFPVGLFDIIALPDEGKYYRVLQDTKGRLFLNETDEERAKWKLCRIANKTMIKGGIIQLNLSDGTNILAPEGEFKVKDTIKISVPEKKVLQRLEYKIGNLAMITGGRHIGDVGKIADIMTIKSSKNNMARIAGESEYETIENYVFVIGEDKPEIRLSGE